MRAYHPHLLNATTHSVEAFQKPIWLAARIGVLKLSLGRFVFPNDASHFVDNWRLISETDRLVEIGVCMLDRGKIIRSLELIFSAKLTFSAARSVIPTDAWAIALPVSNLTAQLRSNQCCHLSI
jgi:hypothetical protein